MTGTVWIGDSQRNLEDADAQWVTEQLRRRRRAGESVCVRVNIKKGNINVTLTSADCPSGGGGGCAPNRHEAVVLDDWNKRGLDGSDFPPGQLVAFLARVC